MHTPTLLPLTLAALLYSLVRTTTTPQVKDALSALYSHVSQLSSGPITAGGGEDDGDKDDDDTAYVSDKFSIVASK